MSLALVLALAFVAFGSPSVVAWHPDCLLPDTGTAVASSDTAIPVLTQELVAPVIAARKNIADIVRAHPELQSAADKMSIPLKITMVEIIMRTPLFAEAVGRAGLTAQSYARVAAAINMAAAMDVIMRSVNPDMQAKGVMGTNVSFIRNHLGELEPFVVAPGEGHQGTASPPEP